MYLFLRLLVSFRGIQVYFLVVLVLHDLKHCSTTTKKFVLGCYITKKSYGVMFSYGDFIYLFRLDYLIGSRISVSGLFIFLSSVLLGIFFLLPFVETFQHSLIHRHVLTAAPFPHCIPLNQLSLLGWHL